MVTLLHACEQAQKTVVGGDAESYSPLSLQETLSYHAYMLPFVFFFLLCHVLLAFTHAAHCRMAYTIYGNGRGEGGLRRCLTDEMNGRFSSGGFLFVKSVCDILLRYVFIFVLSVSFLRLACSSIHVVGCQTYYYYSNYW